MNCSKSLLIPALAFRGTIEVHVALKSYHDVTYLLLYTSVQ